MAPLGVGQQVVHGSVWIMASTALLLPVNLVTGVVVARFLGPVAFGELAVLLVFLALAAPLSDIGFGQSLLQWGGRAIGARQHAAADLLFRKSLGFHVAVQLPIMVAGGAFLLRGESAGVLGLFVLIQLALLSFANANTRLVVENRSVTRAKLNFVSAMLGNATACFLAVVGSTPAELYVGRTAVALVPAVTVLWLLTPDARRSLLRPMVPRSLPPGFWRFARASWVAAALGAVIANRSEVLVLRFFGEAAAVGVFAVAFGLAVQTMAPLGIIQANLTPAMTLVAGRNEGELGAVVERSVRVFGLGASAVLAVSGTVVLAFPLLYGEEYRGGAALLPPLLIAACLQTALTPYSALAVVKRRRRIFPFVQLVTVVADLGLAILLVPVLGVVGAVVGAATGLALVNVALMTAEVRSLRAAMRVLMGTPFVEGLLCLAVSLAAGWPLREQPLLAAPVALVVGGGLFLTLIRLVRRELVVETLRDLAPLLPVRLSAGMTRVARRLSLT